MVAGTENVGAAFFGCILLAEDSAIIALDTADTLRELGFEEVLVARDATAAQTLLAARTDLRALVLDLDLDGESGTPVARAARAAGLPVVVASGYADPGPDPAFVGVPRLRKPYTREALAQALAQALATA
ncbi:response regulator [Salinarimonas rosea]|uniref:response regulator n=1 Tax=Salinarimonas rosea TaxID=552063 RepID=UPI00041A332B|nr:response regulator [Salinarimonas rosea]